MPAPSLYPFTAVLPLIPFAWMPAIWLHTAWVAWERDCWPGPSRANGSRPQPLALRLDAIPASGADDAVVPTADGRRPAPVGRLAARVQANHRDLAVCLPADVACRRSRPGTGRYQPADLASITPWLPNLREAPNAISALTLRGGALVLLALLKWRRPEARLLAATACVPHTLLPDETLPLFLVPQTWLEACVFSRERCSP